MILSLFKQRGVQVSLCDIPTPWRRDSESLLSRVRAAERLRGGAGVELELDEHNPTDPEQIRWVAGALDALVGGKADSENRTTGRSLTAALGAVIRRPSTSAFSHFYKLSAGAEAIGIVDGFLDAVQSAGLRREAVAAIARYIASNAPDLNVVKLMISLLGISSDERDQELVVDLGVYEELTLYSAVTLSRILDVPEPAIWDLAKRTRGWGRIQAIRRLKHPVGADVQHWLLTEGHRNGVMAEEVAYFCAVEGRLLEALRNEQPSEALLDGAGELLAALINGGPAEDMDDYADGGEAARLFIEHVGVRKSDNLERFIRVRSLLNFVSDTDADWQARESRGWSANNRWAIRMGAAAFLARPEWAGLVEAGLRKSCREDFWPAAEVARALNIDTWPHYLRRQQELRSEEWYFLMQTDDASRVSTVIDLALEQLDLLKVGSGPTKSIGLGPDYEDDNALDFILQDLRRFPGMGWSILEVGLRARTIRARNMAHRALDAWDRSTWPSEALPALRAALEREPDVEVAKRTLDLIEGKSIT